MQDVLNSFSYCQTKSIKVKKDHFCLSSQQLFALPYISLHFSFFQRNISAHIQGIPPLKALTVLIVPLQEARLCVKQS